MSFVLDAGLQVGIPNKKYYALRLAVEEFVVNCIRHGYLANNLKGDIEIHVRLSNGYFVVTIIDTAGLRKGGETVEKEGMRRSENQILEADLVLLITVSRHESN